MTKKDKQAKAGTNPRAFSDDSVGIKVSPMQVLVFCLLYVSVVVICHIGSKMGVSGQPGEGL
jgi:hypothetical protein